MAPVHAHTALHCTAPRGARSQPVAAREEDAAAETECIERDAFEELHTSTSCCCLLVACRMAPRYSW